MKQQSRKDIVKKLIKELHRGADPDEVKKRFQEALEDLSPAEIAKIEEELIKEGMPREEMQKLCDVHISVFKESLEKEKSLAPPGHPVNTLMEEHAIMLGFASDLKGLSDRLEGGKALEELDRLVIQIKDSEKHYLREENVLFPYLEKHGVTQPPAIMWMEHDKIREIKKELYGIVDNRKGVKPGDFSKRLGLTADKLAEALASHFYKENNILFPTAIEMFDEREWAEVTRGFEEIGYCSFTPESAKKGRAKGSAAEPRPARGNALVLETGSFTKEELETVLNHLPIDITFVDANDSVQYFSESKDRIFVRTKAIVGRKVQQCHPEKSVHLVNQILEDFKNGRRNVAEFWLPLGGRLVHIRYFAIRDRNGTYMGCLEVTQDITDIKKIEGQKRLL